MLDYTKLTIEYLGPISNNNSEKIWWEIKRIAEKSEYTLDTHSVFWENITDKEKNMINSWSSDFKQKMIDHKLKYNEGTIELEIDWEKIVFDKKQPIKEIMDWADYMYTIKTLEWRKEIDYKLMEKLVIIFKWRWEVLGLTNDIYWSSPTNITKKGYWCYGNFNLGYMFTTYMTNLKSVACIYN